MPKKDPKDLLKEKPDYTEDRSGIDETDRIPVVGGDPESLPEEGTHKTIIAPDPEKVREHDRRRGR